MVQRGGDAAAGLTATLQPEQVFRFILEGSIPSPSNVGAPISFNIKHLYDATPVRMSNTLKYSYDKVTFVPRTKQNNLSFFLKDILLETSANGKWIPSNRGHIRVNSIYAHYGRLSGGARRTLNFLKGLDENLRQVSLRTTEFVPINQSSGIDCGLGDNALNLVPLEVSLDILPKAYKDGIIGDRSGNGVRKVVLTRTFHYNQGEWKALPNEGEPDTPEVYKYTVDGDEVTLEIHDDDHPEIIRHAIGRLDKTGTRLKLYFPGRDEPMEYIRQ